MQFILFDSEGVLRSGWRMAVFLMAFTFAALALQAVGQVVLASFGAQPEPGTGVYLVTNAVISLIPALLVGWLCAMFLEKLPFRSLGASFTDGWLRHLLLGLVAGGATLATAVLIAYMLGGLRFAFNNASSASDIVFSLAASGLVFGAAAAFEEALFRGYILQTFARAGLAWLAILMTAAVFGLVHMGNPNADLISTINTFLAGIWFGIAYMKTRDLWFVWGLHLMWNWMQGSIFGIEVSGMATVTASPLLKEIDHGPTWLTGQAYGIEGGIACTIAIVLSGIVIYYLPGLVPAPEMLRLTSQQQPREAVPG